MEHLSGRQALLEQQVKSSMDALTNMLSTAQLEIRNMTNKFGEVAAIQHSQDANRATLDELKKSVSVIGTRMETWFKDFDNRNNLKWEAAERNRDDWRLRHEAENENAYRTLETDLRSVRETVIRSLGWGVAAGTLTVVIVSGFLWSINDRFATTKERSIKTDQTIAGQAAAVDRLRDKTTEIELYLARGGVNPQEPYKTKQQQGSNGNGK
jgi:hypothetical protein